MRVSPTVRDDKYDENDAKRHLVLGRQPKSRPFKGLALVPRLDLLMRHCWRMDFPVVLKQVVSVGLPMNTTHVFMHSVCLRLLCKAFPVACKRCFLCMTLQTFLLDCIYWRWLLSFIQRIDDFHFLNHYFSRTGHRTDVSVSCFWIQAVMNHPWLSSSAEQTPLRKPPRLASTPQLSEVKAKPLPSTNFISLGPSYCDETWHLSVSSCSASQGP